MDVLLKDELVLSDVKEAITCGSNAITAKGHEVYEGVMKKESIWDENILDIINVHKIEL